MMWISIRNWRKFQHYDPAKRIPPWIKNNTELLHDAAYLGLSGDQRSILHGLWLEYASARCQLPADPRSLSRRLNLRVTKRQLEALYHAGFIDFVASRLLAEGYQHASAALASRAPAGSLETEKEQGQDQEPLPALPQLENWPGNGSLSSDEIRKTAEASLAAAAKTTKDVDG